MKITEYPSTQFFDKNDVLIKDGANGTKQIKASDMAYALFDSVPEMHKMIFRGKSLGTTFTSVQKEAIENGSFHDIWLGDYWESGDIKYRIVDFDYYYGRDNSGDNYADRTHHLVVMPDDHLVDTMTSFNSSSSSYEYLNCTMRTSSVMTNTQSIINSFFDESNICQFRDNVVMHTYINGSGTGAVTVDRDYGVLNIEVPSIDQVLGFVGNRALGGVDVASKQFALFARYPFYVRAGLTGGEQYYWTRDVSSASPNGSMFKALKVSGSQSGEADPTSDSHGYIRPYFCLKG